jgi:hypothetical protein
MVECKHLAKAREMMNREPPIDLMMFTYVQRVEYVFELCSEYEFVVVKKGICMHSDIDRVCVCCCVRSFY